MERTSIEPCISFFLKKLGVDLNFETDPNICLDILKYDMRLDSKSSVIDILGKCLHEKENIQDFILDIIYGIQKNHPALLEFIKVIVEKNLLMEVTPAGHQIVYRAIHHTYLLHKITIAMVENLEFGEKLFYDISKKKYEIFEASNFLVLMEKLYKTTGSFFHPIKLILVELFLRKVFFLIKKERKSSWGLNQLRGYLILNILEAVLKDVSSGFGKNAFCGLVLCFHKIIFNYKIEGKTLHLKMDPKWCALYEAWNFCFMMGNLKNSNLIYPKLLIPCVVNGVFHNYFIYRAYSLFLTVNFGFYARSEKKALVFPGQKNIAKEWGAITLKYALNFSSAFKKV